MTKQKRGGTGIATPRSKGASHHVERVRKRDGRCVPFQRPKIALAIRAAMEAVGELDEAFAEELAGVVEMSLLERVKKRIGRRPALEKRASAPPDRHRSPEGDVPTIEEIQDLVERALMELGRPRVAKAYILYRDRRGRIRDAVQVHRSDALHARLRVREDEGVSSWSKGRIVSVLMEEAELSRDAAEEVASAVEHRVFDSGAKCITTGLIRELVAVELFERGWIRALSATRIVGIARNDVEQILRGTTLEAWREPERLGKHPRDASLTGSTLGTRSAARRSVRDVGEQLSGELLRRFCLEDVLSEGAGELHRAGDLHVVGLKHPELPLSLCVPADLLAGSDRSIGGAFGLLNAAGELAREVREILVLERPARLLEPLTQGTSGPGDPRSKGGRALEHWLCGLTAISKASGTRIALGSCSDAPSGLTAQLVEALASGANDPACPWLYLDGTEIEELLGFRPDLADVVERLFARGILQAVWGTEHEAYVGPGCHRFGSEPGVLSCGGAIALNLPRLARRAGPWREGMVLSGLAELVGASIELAQSLAQLQDEVARSPAGLHTRRAFALVPVGLREALAILGDGTADPAVGARLCGMLAEAARRFAAADVPDIVGAAPCSVFAHTAAQRFAWIDARKRHAGGHQGWLFEDEEFARERPRPYSTGIRLSPFTSGMGTSGMGSLGIDSASGRAEAEVSKTLFAGSLSMVSLPSLDSPEERPHIAAWRRFEERRRECLGTDASDADLFPTGPFTIPTPVATTQLAAGPDDVTESPVDSTTLRPQV